MPGAQCEEDRQERVLDGTVNLPGKYGKLIEEVIPGYREEGLILVGAEVRISVKSAGCSG